MIQFIIQAILAISPLLATASGLSIFMLQRSLLWRRIAYVSASVGILGIPLSIIAAGATAQLFAAKFISCSRLLCQYSDSIVYGSLVGLTLSLLVGVWFAKQNIELRGVRLWVTGLEAVLASVIFLWLSYLYYVAILPSVT